METDDMDILIRHPVPRRRLTVSEYHHLGQVGILGENDRVELLEGQLVEMSPIGPRHALAVDALHESLVMAVAGKAAVRGQNPVTLDDGSEPQPDIAVVRRPWRGYPGAHPGPDDILLLIEVADSSFNVDSGAKLEMYAKAGIREFWIVDLKIDVVHVHRKPSGLTYKSVTTVKPSEMLELEGLPGISIAAGHIFV
jgi:Uma2 family endonuclease